MQDAARGRPMTTTATAPRILWLDRARGVAVIGMVLFHLARDLEFFGWLTRGTTMQGGWSLFSTLIAGSFLALSGFSLQLAHSPAIRWQAFWRRLAWLTFAAVLVTLATRIAMPDHFIYFGILHALALSSLLGLALLRLPAIALMMLALLVLLLPRLLGSSFTDTAFDHPALWWLGLVPFPRPTLDFEPILPWFAPFLFGMAMASLALAGQVSSRWLLRSPATPGPVTWMGRHSLAIYLIHQPVLLAILWGTSQIIAPATR